MIMIIFKISIYCFSHNAEKRKNLISVCCIRVQNLGIYFKICIPFLVLLNSKIFPEFAIAKSLVKKLNKRNNAG